jgi:glycosyltransferase involved in cell wall biosynthesis
MRDDGPLQILAPIFNDWPALRILIERVDDALADRGMTAEMLVIDDGSNTPPGEIVSRPLRALTTVRLVSLRRNLGHQRAIAIGLAYAEANLQPSAVLVMDGDGEDDPLDVPRLIEKCHTEANRKIVFARRAKRSERIGFRFFYRLYRGVYRLATGSGVRIGNFSIVPRLMLSRVVSVPEIWNHYAGGVLKAKLPFDTIDADRSKRFAGQSQMNFVALVMHGLSAISVNSDVLSIRLLLMMLSLTIVSLGGAGWIAFHGLAVPHWLILAAGLLIVLTAMTMFFMFLVLSARSAAQFIPQRDYHDFVQNVAVVAGSRNSQAPADSIR